jgi:exodeoxyribonuclease VII large subunit
LQPSLEMTWGGGSDAALTITALTQHLAALVREDVILQDVWLRGELLNVTRAASGHLYFSLKDANSVLSCVMFRSTAWRMRFKPEPGAQVLVHGAIEVYASRGQYQLVADTMRPSGQGARHLALEQAKARLMREGLLGQDRKRSLPAFPEKVAVVTSIAGAAVRDICALLQASPHPPKILLVPAQVQGQDAEASLVRALRLAGAHPGTDTVILARGGGSAEDLWSFNSEVVARAICEVPVPVISAVGHETDFTLADLAADLRAPTPSAAAELVLARRHEMIRRAQAAANRARDLMRTRTAYGRVRLQGLLRRVPLARPSWHVDTRRQRLDDAVRRLQGTRLANLERATARLARLAGKLEALSPLATLARGYATVSRIPSGAPVTAVDQVQPGDTLNLRMRDGSMEVRVDSREVFE